jgi:hypothetical protein
MKLGGDACLHKARGENDVLTKHVSLLDSTDGDKADTAVVLEYIGASQLKLVLR